MVAHIISQLALSKVHMLYLEFLYAFLCKGVALCSFHKGRGEKTSDNSAGCISVRNNSTGPVFAFVKVMRILKE